MDYNDMNSLLDITDLSKLYDDDGTVLDEIPDMDRFVSLEEFLERGDDNYQKWGLE